MRRDGVEEWKECKLTEIMNLIGGGTPKTSNPDYWNGDIPWISVKDFNGERRYVGDTEKKITKLGLENSSTKILSKGDIIISARGAVGELAIIPSDMAFNQSCYGLRAKDFVDSCFLYYLLKQSVNILKHNTHGSVFDTITRETFENISVKLPPIPTQQKIAAILSSLDDKIELNNKININLEQQAGVLFKNWFVDFEPFSGKMPEGWKVGKLGDFVEIKRGGSPRPIQKFLSDEGYRWLKISDVTSLSAPFVLNIAEHIKEEGLSKTVFLKAGSLVLSNSATPGIPKILDLDTCIHDGWLYFPKSQLSNEYLYLLFKEIRPQLLNLGNGSIFTNLKTDILKNFEISLPSTETLSKFQNIIKPIFEKMLATQREIKQLATLRDTLLPKLMNGEMQI